MEKFLKIPVTNEQYQLVSCNGVQIVEQASTTTVTINYQNGLIATITHATAGSGDETQRDYIQDSIIAALKTKWEEPAYELTALPYAVSGVATAHIVVAAS